LGIPVIQHLPGVGDNFQDHPQFGCIWEPNLEPLPPSLGGVVLFWSSESNADSPNLQILHANFSKSSNENAARFGLPMSGWTLLGSVIQPKSRGRIRLSGSNPLDPVQIEANYLWNPDDLNAAIACVKLCREIGNSIALRPFAKQEVMPGNLKDIELTKFVRDGVITYWHYVCTAKMGRDAMSVVDGNLRVYGIDNLRIADSSIMPRLTTCGTMAPCVIIGRAAELLRDKHKV
jgi:choline dehydrogenase-like flavoprotein